MRTYPRKDILNRYPTLSYYIHMYPSRYPQKISGLISKRVIQLYPNTFFYIQNIYPDRYPTVYPIKISHRYSFISLKISIFDIHSDIRLIYPHNNPILSYFIRKIYLFRYPYSYPSLISHYILNTVCGTHTHTHTHTHKHSLTHTHAKKDRKKGI